MLKGGRLKITCFDKQKHFINHININKLWKIRNKARLEIFKCYLIDYFEFRKMYGITEAVGASLSYMTYEGGKPQFTRFLSVSIMNIDIIDAISFLNIRRNKNLCNSIRVVFVVAKKIRKTQYNSFPIPIYLYFH